MKELLWAVVVVLMVWWLWRGPTVRVWHAAFYKAACLGPVCVVLPGRSGARFFELSVGEYR